MNHKKFREWREWMDWVGLDWDGWNVSRIWVDGLEGTY